MVPPDRLPTPSSQSWDRERRHHRHGSSDSRGGRREEPSRAEKRGRGDDLPAPPPKRNGAVKPLLGETAGRADHSRSVRSASGAPRSDRGLPPPPGPARDGRGKDVRPSRPFPSTVPSSLVLEAQRTLRQREQQQAAQQQAAQQQAAQQQESEGGGDAEPGELLPPAKRSKHSPIVWRGGRAGQDASSPPSRDRRIAAAPTAGSASSSPMHMRLEVTTTTTVSLAARAAVELECFAQQQDNTVDPDASPALKGSPQISGEEELPPGFNARRIGQGAGSAEAAAADAAGAEAPQPAALSPGVVASKWAQMDDESPRKRKRAQADDDALQKRRRKDEAGRSASPEDPDAAADLSPLPDGEGSPPGDAALRPSISMLASCRSVDEFEKVNSINEGTYGVVFRARERKSGKIVALKKIKMDREKEGFPLTSIREINILLSLHHDNIVNVTEVVMGRNMNDIFMVMEFVEHDLRGVMEWQSKGSKHWAISEIKLLMRQLLAGVAYLHDNWVIHRDLKTSNILYSNQGDLKICDFGLARQYGRPLRPYTPTVVTLWYRAPELLLGAKRYSTAIDVWSCGAIMGELVLGEALFQAKDEIGATQAIFKLIGSPNPQEWPGVVDLPHFKSFKWGSHPSRLAEKFPRPSPVSAGGNDRRLTQAGFDILKRMLTLDPAQRISAKEALAHPWFSEVPLAKSKLMMPTYTVKGGDAGIHHSKNLMSSPDGGAAEGGKP